MTHRISKTALIALLVLLTLALSVACNDAPVLLDGDDVGQQGAQVVNGSVDTGHPAIGALHSGNKAACTATLVGKRTVLTAAHCVMDKSYKKLWPVNFYIGKLYYGTKYTAESVMVHPSYAGGNKSDVAVIRLTKNVTGVTPMPVALDAPAKGETIVIVGYGKTGENGLKYGTKRKANNVIKSMTSSTFTMYGSSGGHGNVCNGDSGGPTLGMRNGVETVVGVHSTKLNYCGYAATDMRVDAYYSWISAKAQGDLYGGASSDTEAPKVNFISPSDGATVNPNFTVKVSASDDTGVTKVVLYANAQKIDELTSAPYEFTLSSSPWGTMTLEAVAFDVANRSTSTNITVTVKNPQQPNTTPPKPIGGSCSKATECGSGLCVSGELTSGGYCSRKCNNSSQCPGSYSCTNSVCVKSGGNGTQPGNGGNNSTPPSGGYGATCTGPASCGSGLCALDNVTSKRFCTMFCDVNSAANSCGAGSACQPAGGGKAVCAPLHNGGIDGEPVLDGGCSVSATGATSGWTLMLLSLLGLGLVRRRR